MSRDFKLTEDQPDIHGQFWIPGMEQDAVQGIIQLRAGQSPRVRIARFVGDDVRKAFERIAPRKIILGHDDHGRELTLINCMAGQTTSTMAMVEYTLECQAVIFGAALPQEKLNFDKVSLYFDHQNQWIRRYAFESSSKIRTDGGTKCPVASVQIPFVPESEIPLNLPGYASSEFFLSWGMKPDADDFHLQSRTYLSLEFLEPRSWSEVQHEVETWRRFFALAMRNPVRVCEFTVYRNDCKHPTLTDRCEPLDVWVRRTDLQEKPVRKLIALDFHFTYDSIAGQFPSVIQKWQAIQQPWEAVLNRFFSVIEPRDLWVNEKFLFLAQAVESLHRARTGERGDVQMTKAAKEAWLASPTALQSLLGERGKFVSQLHKSRNYWIHYGKPGPDEDPDILNGIALADLNAALRRLIEAAIMMEIGIPEKNVANVWADRWNHHWIEFK